MKILALPAFPLNASAQPPQQPRFPQPHDSADTFSKMNRLRFEGLTLARRVGQQIDMTGDISVHVVGIKGRKVRLGIIAPTEVPIRRGNLDPVAGARDDAAHKRSGMLILTQSIGENITIGDNITVTVTEIDGSIV